MKKIFALVSLLLLISCSSQYLDTQPVAQVDVEQVEQPQQDTSCLDEPALYIRERLNIDFDDFTYLRSIRGFPFAYFDSSFVGEDGHEYDVMYMNSGFAASGADMYVDLCVKKDGEIIESKTTHGRDNPYTNSSCVFHPEYAEGRKIYCDLTLGSR